MPASFLDKGSRGCMGASQSTGLSDNASAVASAMSAAERCGFDGIVIVPLSYKKDALVTACIGVDLGLSWAVRWSPKDAGQTTTGKSEHS